MASAKNRELYRVVDLWLEFIPLAITAQPLPGVQDQVITATFLVVLGLGLLVLGGEVLLRGAVDIAVWLKLTPAVIGLTVVAAGTSVPELAVSAIAAWQGSTEIAVGNVVGSNIFNILFILGLASLLRPLAISGNTIRLEYPVLALVTLLCVVVCYDGRVGRLDGVLFLAIYVAFTVYLVRLVRAQLNDRESDEFKDQVKELSSPQERPRAKWLSLLYVVLGVALLGGGAHSTVTGAVMFAELVGLSQRVIALTIVAAGTGLPEVVTSLVSTYRGRDDVAIGNVIGSNLFNILVILGLNSLIAPMSVPLGIVHGDNWWMLGVTVLLFPILFTGRRINRLEGIGLLAIYVGYICQLLWRE